MDRRVALVQPWVPDGNYSPNLGLLYLAAVLEAAGLDTRLFDESLDRDYLDQLVAFSPQVVGFTAVTAAINRVCRAAARAKRALPETVTVVGGPHATVRAEEVLDCQAIDFCVVGEGEYPFRDLCQALGGEAPLDSVPNIVRRAQGETARGATHALLSPEELDALPMPAFHLLDIERVFAKLAHGLYSRGRRILPLMTTRGCPCACTFCARVMGERVRARSAASVLTEVGHLVRSYQVDEIYFEDDNFTAQRGRALQILEGLRKEYPGLHIKFANGLRADRVDEELLEAIRGAGGYWVGFGIESGSRRVLGLMKKRLDLTAAKQSVALAKKHGLKTGSNFIIGYPGETWADILESVRFFRGLELDSLAIVNLVPFPGTEVHAVCAQNGLLTDAASDYDNYFFGMINARPLIRTPQLSPTEVRAAIWVSYLLFYGTSWTRLGKLSALVLKRLMSSPRTRAGS